MFTDRPLNTAFYYSVIVSGSDLFLADKTFSRAFAVESVVLPEARFCALSRLNLGQQLLLLLLY